MGIKNTHWMQTYTGKQFYPLEPDLEDIDIVDISHALANLCRYGGHSRYFYSVAEHCCHIYDALEKSDQSDHKKEGLMHDASEAYITDIIRPVKPFLPEYKQFEEQLEFAIAKKFNLVFPYPAIVKEYDNRILANEKPFLMPSEHEWITDKLQPLPVKLEGWEPYRAKQEFLLRAEKCL